MGNPGTPLGGKRSGQSGKYEEIWPGPTIGEKFGGAGGVGDNLGLLPYPFGNFKRTGTNPDLNGLKGPFRKKILPKSTGQLRGDFRVGELSGGNYPFQGWAAKPGP